MKLQNFNAMNPSKKDTALNAYSFDSEANDHGEEKELAIFGKRQQLRVRFLPGIICRLGLGLTRHAIQRNFGFASIAGLTCTLMGTWEGLFS